MTSRVPTGTELARPFLPAKDFDLSKLFYEALGFEKTLDDEVALFNAGSGRCVGGAVRKHKRAAPLSPGISPASAFFVCNSRAFGL